MPEPLEHVSRIEPCRLSHMPGAIADLAVELAIKATARLLLLTPQAAWPAWCA